MHDPFCKLCRLLCSSYRAPFIMHVSSWMILVIANFLNAELPLLYISRMVRPGGRGRSGNTPPPPEYMAGMIQQFELNR